MKDHNKAKGERDDMVTQVKSVSDQHYQMVMAAKKQQQNKGSNPNLRQLDEVQIQEAHDTAGASL